MKDYCSYCSDNNFEVLKKSKFPISMWPTDRKFDNRMIDFTIARCNSCGLFQRIDFSEKSLSDLYMSEQFVLDNSQDMSRRSNLINKFLVNSESKILDIGGGTNSYYTLLNRGKFNILDFTISNDLKNDRIYCYEMNVSELPSLKEKFDVISIFHTLEHVYDPFVLVKSIYEKLNVNGITIIEVPDISEVIFHNPIYAFFPQHVTYFTKRSLSSLVEKAGFEILDVSNSGTSVVLIAKKSEGKLLSRTERAFEKKGDLILDFNFNIEKIGNALEKGVTEPLQFIGVGGSLTCLFSYFDWLPKYADGFFDRDVSKVDLTVPFTNKTVKPIELANPDKRFFFMNQSVAEHYEKSFGHRITYFVAN